MADTVTRFGGHVPVLLDETIASLQVRSGGRYVDGTFGRGGHSRAILSRGGIVLGIDRDDEAVTAAESLRKEYPALTVAKGRHGDLKSISERNGWNEVDGILLDLGVSSPQLDEAGRGFSFLREGPLDMRMDRSGGLSAADLVNSGDAAQLSEIFAMFGEERRAAAIARAIVAETSRGRRFETTVELADFIAGQFPRRDGKHPATRVFQALRMSVNDEVPELVRALAGGIELLASGGRFAVITFESITDRIVKRFFAAHVGKEVSLLQGGSEWRGEEPRAKQVTKKAVTASEGELLSNPRSRSAKLRVIERL